MFNDAGAKAGMNLQNVRKLQVPYIPLDEQQRFVHLCRNIETHITQAQNHLKNHLELKRQLLKLLDLIRTL